MRGVLMYGWKRSCRRNRIGDIRLTGEYILVFCERQERKPLV